MTYRTSADASEHRKSGEKVVSMVAQAGAIPATMTWRQATYCYIHNVKRETDGFHKTASVLGTFIRNAALSRIGIVAALGMFLDDTVDWVPGLNLITAGDNFIDWPMVAFLGYSLFRIARIRSQFNRELRERYR